MKKHILKRIMIIILLCFPLNIKAYDSASSSIVMDIDTGRILYAKNIHEKRLIASITKVMTAIITIENTDINNQIEIGNEILSMYGTNIYIEVGEVIKIEDLLYGLMLRSGNDSAVSLAKYIGKTEENFIKLMNMKAKNIGMNSTKFENPHGLDDETKNYSTAYDMALLSKYAYQNNTYKKIAKTKKYTAKTVNKTYLWYNRNKLLDEYQYCTGGKNGYTPSAGKTLITTAEKNGQRLTIVTLNDKDNYENHRKLYENAFAKYKNYTIIDKDKFKMNKKIYKNEAYIKKSFTYPLTEEEYKSITTSIIINKKSNPMEKLGYINIKLKDEIIGKIDIYIKDTKKEEISFLQKIQNYLLDNLKKFKLGLQNNLNPGASVPRPLEIKRLESLML